MQVICNYIDCISRICKKYAGKICRNMQFYMQNMHESICCIYCIYTHSPLYWWLGQARLRNSLSISASVKFEQIPMFYPRGCAAPLRRIEPIATLERFVVYCSLELIISGRAPGRGPEGTGKCSSCYGLCQYGPKPFKFQWSRLWLWQINTGSYICGSSYEQS